MNDKESIEFFQTLLLSTNERIPVRVLPHNGNGWFRGTLTGVNGEKLKVIPINGQHKHREIQPSLVRIQEGKLSSKLQKLINDVKNRIEGDKAESLVISNPMFEVALPKIDTPEPTVIVPTAAHEPDLTTAPEPIIPMENKTKIKQDGFAEKLQQFKQLQAELLSRANTEGIDRLKSLHQDLEEAKEMVFAVESDIISTCKELAEFGVTIPDELKPPIRMADTDFGPKTVVPKAKMLDNGLLPEQLSDLARNMPPLKKTAISGPVVVRQPEEDEEDKIAAASSQLDEATIYKNKNNWCGGKARRYRDKIIQYFNNNNNYLASGIEVMEYVGETVAAPTSVLMPLVESGTLKRIGIRNNVRYQLNLNNA